ncbi:hypothetical protein AGMMS50284_6500 [Clostridia bacterium]|nr:hypothetical protein AGMMS50284_6500 [Clostridia bacterium]
MSASVIYFTPLDIKKAISDKMPIACVKDYCHFIGTHVMEEIRIVKDVYGKPHVSLPHIYMSISHTNDIWFCAVDSSPIGIDVERYDVTIKEPLKSNLRKMMPANDSELSYWTKIESCSKLIGTGLTLGISQISELVNSGQFGFWSSLVYDNYLCTICKCNKGCSSDHFSLKKLII